MSITDTTADLKAALEPLGNARGVRLPEAAIERCGLQEGVEIEVREDEIVLRRPRTRRNLREGWEEAIRASIEKYGPPEIDHEFLDFPTAIDDPDWTEEQIEDLRRHLIQDREE